MTGTTEHETSAPGQRARQLAIVVALAALLVGVAIAVSQGGNDETSPSDQVAQLGSLYDGIPQRGTELGDPDAPVAMIEFADPQCPFCAQYAEDILPEIIERYVRPGDLRLELNLVTFIGADSERLARMALAAGEQDLMWQYVDLVYGNQGAENSGYATDEFLRELADAVPGLNADQAFADRDSAEVTDGLSAAQRSAERLGADSTPSFFTAVGSDEPEPLQVSALEPEEFTEQLGLLLPGGSGG